MAQHTGQGELVHAPDEMQIAVAQTDRSRLQQDLVRPGRRDRQVMNHQWFAKFFQYRSFHVATLQVDSVGNSIP